MLIKVRVIKSKFAKNTVIYCDLLKVLLNISIYINTLRRDVYLPTDIYMYVGVVEVEHYKSNAWEHTNSQ